MGGMALNIAAMLPLMLLGGMGGTKTRRRSRRVRSRPLAKRSYRRYPQRTQQNRSRYTPRVRRSRTRNYRRGYR